MFCLCIVGFDSNCLGRFWFSKVLEHYPEIIQFSKWAGALFLFCYGFQHALRAFKSQQGLEASPIEKHHLVNIILLCLALTWLNPHVYLDTVILLGSISTQFEQPAYFALGAVCASWLFSLLWAMGLVCLSLFLQIRKRGMC